MPYRVDLPSADNQTLDRLVELGALDVERAVDGRLAALMPDSVAAAHIARALGLEHIDVSTVMARDAGSVWILSARPIQIGRLRIVPTDADEQIPPGALRLLDTAAFGTGLHPTTALCLEALQEIVENECPASILDVGTGSGILALAALLFGVSHATGLDIDADALRVAGDNARLNGLDARFSRCYGDPATVVGTWPLIFANVLAAPLIDMAPVLVRRVGHRGRLVLSGIPSSVAEDVALAYRHVGMLSGRSTSRGGWVALEMRAPW